MASARTPGATAGGTPPTTLVQPTRVDDEQLREAVWNRVQLARNVKRPHTLEMVRAMGTDVQELHGDRVFGDDPALVGGLARIGSHRVVFLGHQKGAEVEENVARNFGMPHPEGYRKAMRLMRLAERLGIPVVTFIDTPGAYPGAASEERGVAESIARSIMVMTGLRTPIVAVITGEGGSGGALAVAVGDVVLALENAIYSVISPEGCASILWRTPEAAQQAAVAMRITAGEQQALGVIDIVVPEPADGAHARPDETAKRLQERIVSELDRLVMLPLDELVEARYARYRGMGAYTDLGADLPVRAERHGLAERIRQMLGSGRGILVGELGPLRSGAADEAEDPPLREDV